MDGAQIITTSLLEMHLKLIFRHKYLFLIKFNKLQQDGGIH